VLFSGTLGSYSLQPNGKIFQPKVVIKNQISSADDVGKMMDLLEEVAPKSIDDFSPQELAQNIATSLQDLSNNELAAPIIQVRYC